MARYGSHNLSTLIDFIIIWLIYATMTRFFGDLGMIIFLNFFFIMWFLPLVTALIDHIVDGRHIFLKLIIFFLIVFLLQLIALIIFINKMENEGIKGVGYLFRNFRCIMAISSLSVLLILREIVMHKYLANIDDY